MKIIDFKTSIDEDWPIDARFVLEKAIIELESLKENILDLRENVYLLQELNDSPWWKRIFAKKKMKQIISSILSGTMQDK